MIFGEYAQQYYDLGLSPLPLGKPNSTGRNAKAAFTKGWQKVARDRYDQEVLGNYIKNYSDNNIGIALGTILFDGLQIVAIDVDEEQFVEYVEKAMPSTPCGKKGKKGVTWFALSPSDITTKRITNSEGTLVEFLAMGSQTVVPKSIHPETKEPYFWIGEPLYEMDLHSLPVVSNGFILEMQSIATGNGVYFIGGSLESGEEIAGINNMVWKGVNEGGDTYDSRLRCIAHMVATGWEDEDVIARIRRAQREAVEQFGEVFEWPDCERETQQQIDDARSKNFDEAPKKKSRIPAERTWAEWIRTQLDNPVCYADLIYSYEEGYYRQISRSSLSSLVIKTFQTSTAPKALTSVNTFCGIVHREEFGTEGSDKICLVNGTLEVPTQSLRPWSPEDELLYRLDVEWDGEQDCPIYDAFVNWVFNEDEDAIRCWNEFCGLSFVDDVSFQKALFLLGGGANGKSTLVGLLNGIHCRDMVSTVAITELDSERKVTSMVGKLLNVSTEQSRINSVTDSVFKQIVGGDPISTRKLYSEADNNIILKVRFLCLANEMPSLQDSSYAIKRRLIILNCPNTVEEKDQDTDLLSKLLEEKAGIFNKWVLSLASLKKRGRFTIPAVSEELVADYVEQSDPVGMWANMRVEESTRGIDINQAYYDFKEWANLSGYKNPCALPFWRRRMEKLGYRTKKINIAGRYVVEIYIEVHQGMKSSTGTDF